MVRRFRLLNGEERDLDHQIDGRSFVDHDRTVTLRADYAQESLPWWQTYQTDNGPTSPTFNGLATGDTTEIQLDTSGTNVSDVTSLSGPTVNWSNWSELRCYLWGATATAGWPDQENNIYLSDARDPRNVQEGIGFAFDQNGAFINSITAGSDNAPGSDQTIDFVAQPHSLGFRMYNNDNGPGHSIDFVTDGQFVDSWSTSQAWPAAQDLTFHLSTYCTDTPTVETLTIDGWIIDLIK